MPVVSVPSRPNGFPIASTFWPTCKASESPRCSMGSLLARLDLQQRDVVGFIAAQQARLVVRLIGQRDFELPLIGNHVAVRQDLAVLTDQESRTLVLGRINLEKNGAPVDGAGDVYRGEVRALVDLDVVILIGAQAGAVRDRRPGPKCEALAAGRKMRRWPQSVLVGDEKKSAHQQSGDEQIFEISY